MKRFSAIILAILTVFAILTGCSSSADTKDNEIIIGIDDKFAPMGFRDKDNNLVGFDIDYAKAAVEKMGKEVKFQPIDWKTKESELSSGRIDLIWNGYTITDKRKEMVLFTKPYLANAQVIATKADSDISALADLDGKVIGLQGLSSASDALNANPIKDSIKSVSEYADNVLALSDLKAGRVDAVIIDEVVIDYYMAQEEGTFKVLDESLAPEEYGVGVKKGNDELLKELQKALDELSADGTAAEISEKWFGEDKVLN
ncbi:amino acid ABC transporter substrate-binding protein [Bacillus sp. DTU_2020_1000418_1_SI_GHA_SEK_038]|uniref:amino acid ABC transporter substrate-binding protein n=1 Tax=Bacillus sp. DTU_2020_1000418_1_SI_GHA_SEK_038 TaxID=3077585 RepID=UPI0028F155D7|nr:amino acid ABC transporter substrate-binding protein [Bacillus sp. DTU_2020_1000418_1_SI_GHA_SEK_038]WNS75363.1 amino acid ABC transporter substrate-binding protein [Bacillus sp. DTU_2020_1000418_1_SI_GHA_SEK_038]